MFKIIPSKKARGLCCAYRCPNKHTKKDRFCSKHRHRYNKINNPRKYTFHLLKSNSRKRGINFGLTYEEFCKFCDETNYMEEKGRLASSATIDRIEVEKHIGYIYSNLQKLSKSANSVKRWEEDYPDCPF